METSSKLRVAGSNPAGVATLSIPGSLPSRFSTPSIARQQGIRKTSGEFWRHAAALELHGPVDSVGTLVRRDNAAPGIDQLPVRSCLLLTEEIDPAFGIFGCRPHQPPIAFSQYQAHVAVSATRSPAQASGVCAPAPGDNDRIASVETAMARRMLPPKKDEASSYAYLPAEATVTGSPR
jgi:hypothetical protein